MSKDEKKPEVVEIKAVAVDDVERLKLQNINLQRQLLEERVRGEAEKLAAQERETTAGIEAKYQIRLADYQVNLETGKCTPLTPEQIAQRTAQQRPQPVRSVG